MPRPKPNLAASLVALALALAAPGEALAAQPDEQPAKPGAVVAVGGGTTPASVYRAALARARRADPVVLVIPHATGGKRRGEADSGDWRRAGAREVINAASMSASAIRKAVERAHLIWFGGGAQLKLMAFLKKAKLLAPIRRRHAAGAVVGGTSAGAAVLSEVMLSGRPKPRSLVAGAAPLYDGLGVWPEAIVDQHFVAFRRLGRLLSAVLDRRERIGVGVGEDTAAIAEGGQVTVIGGGSVVIYDARRARIATPKPQQPQAARGVTLHVLREGDSWSW